MNKVHSFFKIIIIENTCIIMLNVNYLIFNTLIWMKGSKSLNDSYNKSVFFLLLKIATKEFFFFFLIVSAKSLRHQWINTQE